MPLQTPSLSNDIRDDVQTRLTQFTLINYILHIARQYRQTTLGNRIIIKFIHTSSLYTCGGHMQSCWVR